MRWSVAEAKQKFSDVVRKAGREPQLIFNRERLVAAVVDPESFEAFQTWREHQQKQTLADAFIELQQIATEERYVLDIPPRVDRRNTFVTGANGLSR